jgi:hypothetical protein
MFRLTGKAADAAARRAMTIKAAATIGNSS